jgi:hypothetical protein
MGTNYFIHCKGPQDIHLGKSSLGWTFAFRAYLTRDGADPGGAGTVVDYASWLRLLDLGEIRDEYGRAVTREGLLALIEARRGGRNDLCGSGAFWDQDGNRFCPAWFS